MINDRTSYNSFAKPHQNNSLLEDVARLREMIDAIDAMLVGTVSRTELGYLDGVTSAIQTQLNGKQASLGFTAQNAAQKGVANGYASLDANARLPVAQSPYTFTPIDAATKAAANGVASLDASTRLPVAQSPYTFTPENAANKGAANGYAGLGSDGKVPSAQLPSYVDDVLEFANYAAFPGTGETGKIYIDIALTKQYRWSGSAYVEITSSPGSTDAVPEGSINLYFTLARVRAAALTGLSTATNAVIAATDTILEAFGKLQAQITGHFGVGGSTHPNAIAGGAAGFMSGTDKTKVDGAATVTGTETLTNKTLTSPTINSGSIVTPTITRPALVGTMAEDIFTMTDSSSVNIDPDNGSIQILALTANRTLTGSFIDGESVTLMIDDGSARTITWTSLAVTWVGGSAPTLATTGYTVIELWKVGGVMYGCHAGNV